MRRLAVLLTVLLVAGCSVIGTKPSPSASSAPWVPPPVPSIPGERVFSVSEAISARDAGALGSQSIDLGGYWSDNPLAMSCPPPSHDLNPLEMWCSAGFGITERFEMAWTVRSNGVATSFTGTDGPVLAPYVPSDLHTRLSPTIPIGPVPVVVAGHFNDSDAESCVPDARERCHETFVIESILVYEPSSAPTLPPTPSPTLIPSSAPGLFDATRCAGDVAYSFVGWTTGYTLNIPMDFEDQAWAVVTKGVVPLGDWFPDPNVAGHFSLAMGRRVCLGFPVDASGGSVTFSVVKGTAYRLWDDGRRTTTDEMGEGSGDPSFPAAGSAPPLPEGLAVSMRGKDLPNLAATIHDWSGELLSARPATDEELALPGSETGNGTNAAALVMPDDARSVLVVMAECGSDPSVSVSLAADRMAILLIAANRTDCGKPGARRGAVLSFGSDVPPEIAAFAGF